MEGDFTPTPLDEIWDKPLTIQNANTHQSIITTTLGFY